MLCLTLLSQSCLCSPTRGQLQKTWRTWFAVNRVWMEWIKHPAQVLRMGSESQKSRKGTFVMVVLCVESVYKRWVSNTAELNAEVQCSPSVLQHTAVGSWGLILTVTIVLCRKTGIFGIFLACRISLEAVNERKTERFFFLREKKCVFSSCTYSAGTWAVGVLPSPRVFRWGGFCP